MVAEGATDGLVEGPHRQARDQGQGRQHQEEVLLSHALVVAADVARQEPPGEARQEPHPHHHRHDLPRRRLADEGQADGREVDLADREDEGADDQPQNVARARADDLDAEDDEAEGEGQQQGADGHLAHARRLAVTAALPRPEASQERHQGHHHDGVEALVPGARNRDAEVGPVDLLVGPELHRVGLLLVHRPVDDVEEAEHDEGADHLALIRGQRRAGLLALELVRSEVTLPDQVEHQPDQHADTSGGEAVVPTEDLPQGSADERREDRAEVDAHVEDAEGAVAAGVVVGVEATDLRGDVRLEAAVAEHQAEQRQEEQRLRRHQEVPDRHQQRAEDHRATLADHTVRQHPTEERREVDEGDVETHHLGAERLERDTAVRVGVGERSEEGLERALDGVEPEHFSPDVGLDEQVLHHVEHQQGLHAVEAEALPHLGQEQEGEAARVPEEGPLARGRDVHG